MSDEKQTIVVRTLSGKEITAVIPLGVGYGVYTEIGDASTKVGDNGRPIAQIFFARMKALTLTVKDVDGKTIPWSQIISTDAMKAYQRIEDFFLEPIEDEGEDSEGTAE